MLVTDKSLDEDDLNEMERIYGDKNEKGKEYVRNDKRYKTFRKASAKFVSLFNEKTFNPRVVCKNVSDFLKNPEEFAR